MKQFRLPMVAIASALVFFACSGTSSNSSPGQVQKNADPNDFGLRSLVTALRDADAKPTRNGSAPGSPFAVDAQLLCVDGIEVRVYEYKDARERAAASKTVDASGSPRGSIVEWRGPPRFYARGRILVLVLNDAARPNALMSEILGPSLTPNAGDGRESGDPVGSCRPDGQ